MNSGKIIHNMMIAGKKRNDVPVWDYSNAEKNVFFDVNLLM